MKRSKPMKRSISRATMSAVATLSHNRAFRPSELSEYLRFNRLMGEGELHETTGTAIVNRLVREGKLKKVEGKRGMYYPTKDGWDWLEGTLSL